MGIGMRFGRGMWGLIRLIFEFCGEGRREAMER